MLNLMAFYNGSEQPCSFSDLEKLSEKRLIDTSLLLKPITSQKRVDILAYCLMPTHMHLILKQIANDGISKFTKAILKSHSQYINGKYKRRGPLWEGRFKNVLVETDEYLLHLTRYIHLNPTSDDLVDKPENWNYSSYKAYLKIPDNITVQDNLCAHEKYIEIRPSAYKQFVEDRVSYQKMLSQIKHLTLE